MKSKHIRKRKHRPGRAVALAIAFLLVTATVAGAVTIAPYAGARMDMTLLQLPDRAVPATILCYDPATRATRTGTLHPAPNSTLAPPERREFVPLEEMPPDLIHAFVAIEDKRFYDHHGVDILRTLRAAGGYVTGRTSFGGSTITQQLVKNLTGHAETTPDRKLREVFLALDLERHAGKEQILETYLNIINLAGGCRGVGAAARRYYSKSVSDLTLPECAAIAAITNNPARFDPLAHPEANRQRRDIILSEMAAQGYITPAERDAAMNAPLDLRPTVPAADGSTQTPSWYADLVAADVIRDLTDRLGCTRAHASMLLYSGGLTVECAMDEELQRIVEAYYADESHFPEGKGGRPQSSFILIDPRTGDILAVAGAVGEKRAARLQNYATDTVRPAGSCLKPLSVYAPALEEGLITWATLCEDSPLEKKDGTPWPANADGVYRGDVTVGEAVAESINTVAVRLVDRLGVPATLHFLRDRLGMQSLVLPGQGGGHDATLSSMALGQQTRGVTSRELTAAYTVFYDGQFHPAVSYHRVLDAAGNVLLENKPAADRVLSPANAAVMTRLLMTVTDHGTAASRIHLSETRGIDCAGKTGTTQQNCDRRYVGFTPRLLAGVWMGYDYPAPLDGIRGNPCVSIWDDLMTACEDTYRGAPPACAFPVPDDIVAVDICSRSGALASPYCTDPDAAGEGAEADEPPAHIERAWFVRGTEPTEVCPRHTEPPVHIRPENPEDPGRIPHLPGDLVPDGDSDRGWLSRWFRRHAP